MIALNITDFRTLFPEFTVALHPDATVTMNWDTATLFISDQSYGWMSDAQRQRALELMTAHTMLLSKNISDGETPKIVNSSSIDKISVTAEPPKITTQFHYWLALTPYGTQLLALLKMDSVCGMYAGGRNERSAFRKVGGSF